MKTQNNKLAFNKSSIVELNDQKLLEVNGGTSPLSIAVSVAVSVYTYYETGTKEVVKEIMD
ncbi:class I lanthipeptide [Corallibacter sp.]|uniref:class I lanthipeptide n=1 Tax=Corallibacter sp. TaxID=2038084 RepID=UPI003A955927